MQTIKKLFKKEGFRDIFFRGMIVAFVLLAEAIMIAHYIDFEHIGVNVKLFVSTATPVYILVFLMIPLFFMLSYKELFKIKSLEDIKDIRAVIYGTLNILSVIGFYLLSRHFVNVKGVVSFAILLIILWWILGLMIIITLILALFSIKDLKYVYSKLKRQVNISVLLTIGMTIIIYIIQANHTFTEFLWTNLSKAIAYVSYWILKIFFSSAKITVGHQGIPGISIPNVSLGIGSLCSGIQGIFIFLFLFSVLVYIKRKDINVHKTILLYVLGVIGSLMVNVLRIVLLFTVGYFTSQEFAIKMFHSNIGWIMFSAYFVLFVYLSYPWIKVSR